MAATTTHVAKCQQHYTSNDGHNLTERSLPSEMTSSPPVAAYSTAGNEPENDGVTKKSDSGVYFAMMLSEYLDKKAMEEDKGDATIVKPNSSSDESNTTTTTTTTTTTATTTTVEPATTTNSANDNVGRLGQHVPHGHPKDETYAEAQVKEVMANLPNLIWVPAHKHPQIAPSEFVNWIQVHGETPAMKQSKVRRQKSKLSRSISYDDANIISNNENEKESNTSASTTSSSSSSGEDSPTSPKDYELPQIQGKDGFAFDRHPTEIDSSPILAPPTHHRTLLRRSAVSARRTASEGNADRRRSRRAQQQSRHAEDTSDRMGHVPTEAVNLHDHPVSMSEWIDLGNASLESSESQHGILSRVHDAESQLLKFMDDDDDDDKKVAKATATMATAIPEEPESDSSYPSATTKDDDDTTCTTTTTTIEPSTLDNKRMTLRRSASDLIPQKSEKKMSWIGALLNGDKKKRRSLRRPNNEKHKDQASLQLTRVNSMGAVSTSTTTTTTGTKKRGLAAFISRSLSKSSSATGRKESKKTKKDPIPPPPSSTATSSVTTVASRHFIHSYRLPIHVERAIYRLSHMKLANPRRPLHQQVVISNFMFWYLSIINPQATQSTTSNNTQWPQEGDEAASFRAPSPSSNNRFQKPSLNNNNNNKKYERRASVSSNTGSSDEEDNVPLSFYRKGDV